MTKNFFNLWNDKHFRDVTFVFGRGKAKKEITGHKVAYAIQSEYFAKMFQNDSQEKNLNCFPITDIKPAVFEIFSKFIYTGKVDSSEFDEELLAVAKKVCCYYV